MYVAFIIGNGNNNSNPDLFFWVTRLHQCSEAIINFIIRADVYPEFVD
jgi:hypothetical protein